MEKYNSGRPFFIAGHSQGALHGQRLVHEYISLNPNRQKFIAAYLIGYILPIKHFNNLYPDLFISKSADDQKSIISWSTGLQGFITGKSRISDGRSEIRDVRSRILRYLPGFTREN